MKKREWLNLWNYAVKKETDYSEFNKLTPKRQEAWINISASVAYKRWNRYRRNMRAVIEKTWGYKKSPVEYYSILMSKERRRRI